MFNCGFIFITEECNPAVDHTYIPGGSVNM